MRATFVDESRPPERKTPSGTSDIMRLRTDSLSRRRTSATISCGAIPATRSATAADGIASHHFSGVTIASAVMTMRSPGPSLPTPRKRVRGGGVKPKVR
jgi:hypothetical protein